MPPFFVVPVRTHLAVGQMQPIVSPSKIKPLAVLIGHNGQMHRKSTGNLHVCLSDTENVPRKHLHVESHFRVTVLALQRNIRFTRIHHRQAGLSIPLYGILIFHRNRYFVRPYIASICFYPPDGIPLSSWRNHYIRIFHPNRRSINRQTADLQLASVFQFRLYPEHSCFKTRSMSVRSYFRRLPGACKDSRIVLARFISHHGLERIACAVRFRLQIKAHCLIAVLHGHIAPPAAAGTVVPRVYVHISASRRLGDNLIIFKSNKRKIIRRELIIGIDVIDEPDVFFFTDSNAIR